MEVLGVGILRGKKRFELIWGHESFLFVEGITLYTLSHAFGSAISYLKVTFCPSRREMKPSQRNVMPFVGCEAFHTDKR